MLRQVAFALILLVTTASAALAEARMTVLVDVLRLREAVLILRNEGLTSAEALNQEMLLGRGGAGWQLQVEGIYDPDRMVETVRSALTKGLTEAEVEEITRFYASDLGQKVVTLENSAREAMQDADVEAMARQRFQDAKAADEARMDYITHYIEAGDMISRNVTAALNSNLAFLKGLQDGGAVEMSEQEMLDDVTGDLEESTEDTTEWLFGFLLLAYHPLEDEELDRYIAFSDSPAGLALNSALFDGFGRAYQEISYALGQAVALNMTAEEL